LSSPASAPESDGGGQGMISSLWDFFMGNDDD
jgi:hypothetical protein